MRGEDIGIKWRGFVGVLRCMLRGGSQVFMGFSLVLCECVRFWGLRH